MKIRLFLVPYDSGRRDLRMGAGPAALQNGGMGKRLAALSDVIETQVIEPASGNWRAEVQTSFELMRAVGSQVRAAIADGFFPLVLSGNCLSAVGVIAGLGGSTGVLWIDAHGDFNTPQTTTSGFLDGMTLATATGRCWVELAQSIEGFSPVAERAVLLLGARDLDPGEGAALARSEIFRLPVEAKPEAIEAALENLRLTTSRTYLHLDLDVLDPSEGRASVYSARGGYRNEPLQKLLEIAAQKLPIAAMTLASYDPAYDTDGRIRAIALEAVTTVLTHGVASR